jgi:hypothetical protein
MVQEMETTMKPYTTETIMVTKILLARLETETVMEMETVLITLVMITETVIWVMETVTEMEMPTTS